jgi:protein-S-isoprenylcysteine O-methyltransferase Ste14
MTETALPPPEQPRWVSRALLDRIEQVLILLLWGWLVYRVELSDNPLAPLLLISETTVMVFVLLRRPTEAISVRPGDWLLALTATGMPMLVMPMADPLPGLAPLGIGLVLYGNLFQFWAKLSLRRSFGIAPANRGIKIGGPYRLVRHPMYSGYLFAHIGILVLMPSLINLAIYTVSWCAQIFRLLAEERLLLEDPDYRAYAEQHRWRLVPGLF